MSSIRSHSCCQNNNNNNNKSLQLLQLAAGFKKVAADLDYFVMSELLPLPVTSCQLPVTRCQFAFVRATFSFD